MAKPDFPLELLARTPDATIVTTLDGVVAYWNTAAEEIFGFSADEAVGNPLVALIEPPDRKGEERRMRNEALERGLAIFETVRRHKNGSLVHVSVSTKALRDEDGEARYFLHTKKDVTHLEGAARCQDGGSAVRRCMLELTPDAIVMVNFIGRIVLVNAQAEMVFGYSREELVGQPVEALLPERFHGPHRPSRQLPRAAARAHDGRRPGVVRPPQVRRRVPWSRSA